MEDITKIVKSHEDSGFLLKGFKQFKQTNKQKKIQNEAKKQKEGFLSMLLCRYIRCKVIRKYFSR